MMRLRFGSSALMLGLCASMTFGGTATLNRFQSASLGREMTYWVYLPANYEEKKAAGEKFSVIYLLHWWIYWAQGWHQSDGVRVNPRMDQCIDSVQNVIGIAPQDESKGGNGTGNSWWINSQAFGKYGDFISKDLVEEVNSKFPTHADASHNAIAGCSMGGFGALHHIRVNKNVFGKGYGIVALTDLSVRSRTGRLYSPAGCQWDLCTVLGDNNYWNNATIQRDYSPIANVDDYAGVRFGISTGNGDFFFKDNLDFHNKLTEKNIPHDYISFPNEDHEYPTPQKMTTILKFLFENGPGFAGSSSVSKPARAPVAGSAAKNYGMFLQLKNGSAMSGSAATLNGRVQNASRTSAGFVVGTKSIQK